jgi:hypothetical protein
MFQYLPAYARNFLAAGGLAVFGAVPSVHAEALPLPSGEVILTVDGNVSNTNGNDAASFDMDMLMAMPAVTFSTSTTWTEGEPTFTGVSLKHLMEAVGAEGSEITAIALNNYSVTIPAEGLTDEAPIIAYQINGESFSRRDKGPLWIVYPFDSDPAYQNELVYGRSIWQLSQLTIK